MGTARQFYGFNCRSKEILKTGCLILSKKNIKDYNEKYIKKNIIDFWPAAIAFN